MNMHKQLLSLTTEAFERAFPKPKRNGVAMKRWLNAWHQLAEIHDWVKNPYFNDERGKRIAQIIKEAFSWCFATKPLRYRTYRISLGLMKYPTRNKYSDVMHYGIKITSNREVYFSIVYPSSSRANQFTD